MKQHLDELAAALEKVGLDKRYALDLGSVVIGIRPRGLLHVNSELKQPLREIIARQGLVVEFERLLYRRNDANTREGILGERPMTGDPSEPWMEIWYRNPDSPEVVGASLVENPGLHLGYPTCCVSAMEGKSSIDSHYHRYVFAAQRERLWELNRLAALFSKYVLIPDFFPCSLCCVHAADFARPFRSLARKVWGESSSNEAIASAQQPIFLWGNFLVSSPDWSVKGEKLCIDIATAKKVEFGKLGIVGNYAKPALLRFRQLGEILPADSIAFQALQNGTPVFETQIEWA